jgi:hypothetical protein
MYAAAIVIGTRRIDHWNSFGLRRGAIGAAVLCCTVKASNVTSHCSFGGVITML